MKKLMPYSLPMLLSLLFVALAHTNWLWLVPLLIFTVGSLTVFVGEFSIKQLIAEYAFFHYNQRMACFKTINGIFFGLLNVWAFVFLVSVSLPLWHLIVFIYSMIILNSNFAISLAHDLMHSRYRIDRWLSRILLIQNGFFYLEADHIYIHHRHVGTIHDPATAHLGESIYRYLVRSLTGRMRLLFGQNPTLAVQKNQAIRRQTALNACLCGLYLLAGTMQNGQAFGWILSQFVLVVLIYESITYIQHYGLQRHRLSSRYESVQLHHAWNSFYKLNAYLYFMMPVHSLHHIHHLDLNRVGDVVGPRMPLPFARMLVAAYQPGRWFALMNTLALSLRSNPQSVSS